MKDVGFPKKQYLFSILHLTGRLHKYKWQLFVSKRLGCKLSNSFQMRLGLSITKTKIMFSERIKQYMTQIPHKNVQVIRKCEHFITSRSQILKYKCHVKYEVGMYICYKYQFEYVLQTIQQLTLCDLGTGLILFAIFAKTDSRLTSTGFPNGAAWLRKLYISKIRWRI